MKRLSQVAGVALRIGTAMGLLLALAARNKLNDALSPTTTLVIQALIVVIAAESIKWAAEQVLSGSNRASRWIRRKVLGTHYIEGTWIDIVWKDRENLWVGVTKITADGFSVRYSGENFDPATGALAGDFVSDVTAVSWPRMVYMFKARHQGDPRVRSGVGEVAFVEKDDGPPARYNGQFVDIDAEGALNVQGRKIVRSEELAMLDDQKERAKVLKSWAQQFRCEAAAGDDPIAPATPQND